VPTGEAARTCDDEEQPDGLDWVVGVAVRDGDDHEADGVVGDGEQKEQRDRRVAHRKYLHRHHPRQRDVRGGRHTPPAREVAERDRGPAVVEAAAEVVVLIAVRVPVERAGHPEDAQRDQVGGDRAEHAADRAEERRERLVRRVHRAARQAALRHLLGGDAEEEDHEDVVHHEVDRDFVAEELGIWVEEAQVVAVVVGAHEPLVRGEVDVRPHERNHDAHEQREREALRRVQRREDAGERAAG
jgi:hypothetical protein